MVMILDGDDEKMGNGLLGLIGLVQLGLRLEEGCYGVEVKWLGGRLRVIEILGLWFITFDWGSNFDLDF